MKFNRTAVSMVVVICIGLLILSVLSFIEAGGLGRI